MKIKLLKSAVVLVFLCVIAFTGCKKDKKDPDPVSKGTVGMKISDARVPHSGKSINGTIVDPTKLTKCEITLSSIKLKSNDGSYVDILSGSTAVDLRLFQGTVKDLLSVSIPVGSYTAVKVSVSGASTTYDGNNYTASTTTQATATLANIGMTVTQSQGVTNAFSGGEISFELPLTFTLYDASNIENIQLQFDAIASTYIVPFTYQTSTWNLAGIYSLPSVGVILEEGIQQIKHSPPYGITISSGNAVNYYGIHTFYDFKQKGGTINSHTSQHVFRGEDGTLLVDAESMTTNPNTLVPNTVSATGESDIRADETFNYSQIVSYLNGQGYQIVSGKTYYFSLRKTWNITSDGTTYNLTRICEPIPVTIP